MRRLARPDPLILLVGGVIIVCGALGVFEWLGLTADQTAQLEAGAIMVASALRMWLGRAPPADSFTPPSEVPTENASDGG